MSSLSKFFFLLSLGGILGISFAYLSPEPKNQFPIEWLDTPLTLGKFSLEGKTGKFDNQTLEGRWSIVSFGFLNCVDICPTNLAQLATLAESLAKQPIAEETALVFVSVDPERDSVTAIDEYVQHFSPAITGVTGTENQLAQFAGDLGIQFRVKVKQDEYAVAHSSTFSIIDPDGVLRGRFRPNFEAPHLLQDLTTKLQEAGI